MKKVIEINPDLAKERANASINLPAMKEFLGEVIFGSKAKHQQMIGFRDELVRRVRPLSEENFYNLYREEKYDILCKKTLELYDFINEKNAWNDMNHFIKIPIAGAVLGPEKPLFSLHTQAFRSSIDLWATDEQRSYWFKLMDKNPSLFGTYIQTELGHGTFVRGMETTATFDRASQEFVINSPTLSSIKFWPGTGGITANYAIVMAKLIIDCQEHGIHAFVVQLRSLETHKLMPGVESGDIGLKIGFESQDNGYIKFNNLRIPLFCMLMKNAQVTPSGEFKRIGSELVMYACMLTLRASLGLFGALLLSLSTTIAIRYSAVRRQTSVTPDGVELQIMDFQTQQYRLFSALAHTYTHLFSANHLIGLLLAFRDKTNNFKNIDISELGKLHAVSAGIKATTFNNCLRFAQSNRLCCGGHGYSASSGLGQIVQEADGGCTYEGDNVVLLLQTARYLLKCVQKGKSPHFFVSDDFDRRGDLFKIYFDQFMRLYEESIGEVSARMFELMNVNRLSEYDAWNECSAQLVNVAKCYITIYMIGCSIKFVSSVSDRANFAALSELLEFYMLFETVDTYSSGFLKVLSPSEMKTYSDKLYKMLPKIRVNAVALVDAFDYLDSNLCSSLGAYDGNVYERLFEFAQSSKMNGKEVPDVYEKYLKPFAKRRKQKQSFIKSKL